MKRFPIDPEEMERRNDKDYIASLKMVGEGAPVFYEKQKQLKQTEEHGFDENDLPRAYQ